MNVAASPAAVGRHHLSLDQSGPVGSSDIRVGGRADPVAVDGVVGDQLGDVLERRLIGGGVGSGPLGTVVASEVVVDQPVQAGDLRSRVAGRPRTQLTRLEDGDVGPVACQGQPGRKPGDPRSDDHHIHDDIPIETRPVP